MTLTQENKRKEVLVVAHHDFAKALSAHALFKVNNRAMSEDLVQDTFLKTWRYLARGGKIETMKAFLYHVLNRLIIDQYRKHKATSLDSLMEGGFDRGSDDFERLFAILDGKRALLLIERLPATYQKVMRMRYVQDFSLEEMSLSTGQTRNAMAVQVHRGLSKLKMLYSGM